MLSTADKVVPFLPAPAAAPSSGRLEFTPVPGLTPEAIQGLEASYPGTLTDTMHAFLRTSCGLTAAELGTIDFTGRWHPEEPISVFRPCLTLASDGEGRRWIAETSRAQGLPGPVWCILREPAVAIYVTNELGSFLTALEETVRHGRLSQWLRSLRQEARTVWTCRHALARKSYERCHQDRALRGWLAELPFDARIYDLRAQSALRGWPYGLAGPDGRLYRCGRLPLFAICASPSSSGWRQWSNGAKTRRTSTLSYDTA